MARTIAKDHDRKRLNIVKTAARVFAGEGIARASMSQIARECGVSKANIYHYYSSKDDLLFDILHSYLCALFSEVSAQDETTLPPRDRLHTLLKAFLLSYEGMEHEHKIQTEGLPLLPDAQQSILRAKQREIIGLMSGVVFDLNPTAFRDQPGKLRDATMSIFGMLNWFYQWNRNAGPDRRLDYAALLAQFTATGIQGFTDEA